MSSHRILPLRLLVVFLLWGWTGEAQAVSDYPPSPYDILGSRDLETPLLDAVPLCVPGRLDAIVDPILEEAATEEWNSAREMLSSWTANLDRPSLSLIVLDAIFQSRAATDRESWLAAEEWNRALLRRKDIKAVSLCLRLELARLLLLMSRESEASAQLTRAEQWMDDRGADDPEIGGHRDDVAFWRAEVLYRTGRPFDAHLLFRKLAKSKVARLALAARLRLTDLSFDSGKVARVSEEYETLLPRASAFGASTTGWALRASEAAILADEPARAVRWIERFLEAAPSRDARDAAEIRMADLDVEFDDPMLARKRLSSVSGRQRRHAIGALAAVRAIDLGVSPGSPDQRFSLLMSALRSQRNTVRRYTLGVLMKELSQRGDLDGALAVATRLGYEGVDAVITPDYPEMLDDLLQRISEGEPTTDHCREVVRGLGGRYGILIERASKPAPFAQVGECFEMMELPWLAATVYRAIARRFGTQGAQEIALPLARSSLAIGEITLARRVSSAALEDPDDLAPQWRAVLAEANFRDRRFAESAAGLRQVLDAPELKRSRGQLARMLGHSLAESGRIKDADYLAKRIPGWLAEEGVAAGARAALIEATILAAHAYRKAGRSDEAHEMYRVVDTYADAGALRSSARFWLGLAGEEDGSGEPAWGEDPNLALGSPWARYALFEDHVGALWESYGDAVE